MNKSFKEFLDEIENKSKKKKESQEKTEDPKRDPKGISDIRELGKYKSK